MAARFKTTGAEGSRSHDDRAVGPMGAGHQARPSPPAASRRKHTGPEQAAREGRFARAQRATSAAHRFAKVGAVASRGPVGGTPPVGSDDAPRPIGVDPRVTGSFHTLGRGQGAVLSTRESARRAADVARTLMPGAGAVRISSRRRPPSLPHRRAQQRLDPRIVAAIVGAACVMAVALFLALRGAVDAVAPDPAAQTRQQAQTVVSQGVTFGDATLSVQDAGEGQQLVRTAADGSQTVLATLPGTPVSIAHNGQAIYIAENLSDDTWDVLSYVVADGSEPTQLLDDGGSPVGGTGRLASSEVEGTHLVLTDESGAVTTVSLE